MDELAFQLEQRIRERWDDAKANSYSTSVLEAAERRSGDFSWPEMERAALAWALSQNRIERVSREACNSMPAFEMTDFFASGGSAVRDDALRRAGRRSQHASNDSPSPTGRSGSRRMTFDRTDMQRTRSEKLARDRRDFWCQLITFGTLYVLFMAFALLVVLPYLTEQDRPLPILDTTTAGRFRFMGNDPPQQNKIENVVDPPPDQPPTFARRNAVFYMSPASQSPTFTTSVTPSSSHAGSRTDASISSLQTHSFYVHKERVIKEHFFPSAAYNSVEIFSDNSAGGILWISLSHSTLVTKSDIGNATTAVASSSSNVDRSRLKRPMRDYTRGFNE